jgi:hypothetical protein
MNHPKIKNVDRPAQALKSTRPKKSQGFAAFQDAHAADAWRERWRADRAEGATS